MKIVLTTDTLNIGTDIKDDVKIGDVIDLNGFLFYVQNLVKTDKGAVLSNPNYQILLEA